MTSMEAPRMMVPPPIPGGQERRPVPAPKARRELKPVAPLMDPEEDEVTKPRLKKGPPPPPTREKKTPPPLPQREAPRVLENFQERDVVPAFEVPGFDGLEVAVTMEKKQKNQGASKPDEDYFLADPETGLIGVFDGLGGEGKGDLASMAAAEAFPSAYEKNLADLRLQSHEELIKELTEHQVQRKGAKDKEVIQEHFEQVKEMLETVMMHDPALLKKSVALVKAFEDVQDSVKRSEGMTTAVLGFVHRSVDGTRWAVIANTGDSAAYKRRVNGEIVQITAEDSMFNRLRDEGQISPERFELMKQAPDKLFEFEIEDNLIHLSLNGMRPMAARALGGSPYEPALTVRRLEPGDELIFVTDGIVDVFENSETEKTDLEDLKRELELGQDSPAGHAEQLRLSAGLRKKRKDDDKAVLVARAA